MLTKKDRPLHLFLANEVKEVSVPKRLEVWGKELVSNSLTISLLCTDLGVKRNHLCVCCSYCIVEAEMEREFLLVSLSNVPLEHSYEFSHFSSRSLWLLGVVQVFIN